MRAQSPSTKTRSYGSSGQGAVSFEENMDSNVLYLEVYDSYMAEYGMPVTLSGTDGDSDITDDINSGSSNNRPGDTGKADAAAAFDNLLQAYVISQKKSNLLGRSKSVNVSGRELSLASLLKRSCSYEDMQEQRSVLFTATDISLSLSLPPWRKESSSGDPGRHSPDADIHMDAYESARRCPEEPCGDNAAPPSVNSRPNTDTPHMVSAIIPSLPVATQPPVTTQPPTKNRNEAPPIRPLARNIAPTTPTSPLFPVSITPRLKQHRQPKMSPHASVSRSKSLQPADVSYNYKTTYWQYRCRQQMQQRLGSEGPVNIQGQPRTLRRVSAGQAHMTPLSNGPSTKGDDPIARPAQKEELCSPSSQNLHTSSEFTGSAMETETATATVTATATTNATLTKSSPAIVAIAAKSFTARPSDRAAESSPVQKIYYGEPPLGPLVLEDPFLASPLLSQSNGEAIFGTETNTTSVETPSSSSRSSKEKKLPLPVNMCANQLMEAERIWATLFSANGDMSRQDGHPSSQSTHPTSADAGVGAVVLEDGDTADSSATKKGRRIWDSPRLAMKRKPSNASALRSSPTPPVSNPSLTTTTATTIVASPETPSVPERRSSMMRNKRRSTVAAVATTPTITVPSPTRLDRSTHNKSKSQDYSSSLQHCDSKGDTSMHIVGTAPSVIAAVMASLSLPGSPDVKQKNTVSSSATFASSSATLWDDDDHMAQFGPPSSTASVFWTSQSPSGLPSLSSFMTTAPFEPSSPSSPTASSPSILTIKRKKSILHEKLFGKWNKKSTAPAAPEPSLPLPSQRNNTNIHGIGAGIASSPSLSTSSIACSAMQCDTLCQHDKLCQQDNRHYSNDIPGYHDLTNDINPQNNDKSFMTSTNELVHVYDIHENNDVPLCSCSGGGHGSSISSNKEGASSSPSSHWEQQQSPNANTHPRPVLSPPFPLDALKVEPVTLSPPTTLQQPRPRPKVPLSQRPMEEIWAHLLTVHHFGVLPPNAEQPKQSRVANHRKKKDGSGVSSSSSNTDSGAGVGVGVGLGVSIGTDAGVGTENCACLVPRCATKRHGDCQLYALEKKSPEKNGKEEEEDIRRVMQQWQAWGAAHQVRNV
ncbi:hypothetical protein BGZ58_005366 [Dissophora ornata]|nr:hypothetical protein BGZ58_005366 [Dissophora ornata]